MTPEIAIVDKEAPIKQSPTLLSRVPETLLKKHPLLEIFATCIDALKNLSSDEKWRLFTFTVIAYEPKGERFSFERVSEKNILHDLGVLEVQTRENMQQILELPDIDDLWARLEQDIDTAIIEDSQSSKTPSPKKTKLSEDLMRQVAELRRQGLRGPEIYTQLNLTPSTYRHMVTRLLEQGRTKRKNR